MEKPSLVFFGAPETQTEEQPEYNAVHAFGAGGEQRKGQRLTIANRSVTKLGFVLRRLNALAGTVTFTIRRPSDDSLIVSKLWGNAADLPEADTLIEVSLDEPVLVNEEVRILAEATGSWTDGYAAMSHQNTDVKANEYNCRYHTDTWYEDTAWDCAYRYTYYEGESKEGEIDWSKTKLGLLHVRHPALLSGEHRYFLFAELFDRTASIIQRTSYPPSPAMAATPPKNITPSIPAFRAASTNRQTSTIATTVEQALTMVSHTFSVIPSIIPSPESMMSKSLKRVIDSHAHR
ncbi:hypothetical protein ES708_34287 [subsurface metagenome]